MAAMAAMLAGVAAVEVDLPNSLSCNYQQGWPSVAAALSVEAMQGPEPADGLPRICQKLDLDLVEWMVGSVLNPAWPENSTDTVRDFYEEQYYCEPRLSEILKEEMQEDCRAAISSTELSSCLYGSVSIFACILSMLFRHPEHLEVNGPLFSIKSYFLAMRWFLQSEYRMMEFLDSSDWPVNITDLVSIMDAYRDVSAMTDLNSASASTVRARLRASRMPWHEGSFSWRMASLAAKQSLAAVSGWSARRPTFTTTGGTSGRVAVRIWAFGTHCSVMAEPVSVMTTLLSEEFQINVSWQGASDYCQYHSGAQRDGDSSAFRKLYVQHWRKAGTRPVSEAHRDSLTDAQHFAQELQALLLQDEDFQHSDLTFCSEPAIACLSMHRAGKPVIGYFGVHVAFMLNKEEEQESVYRAFVDELSQDHRNSFATKAPYLSLQIYSHTSLKFPAVRPLSLYTQPVAYSGASSTQILLNRRPVLFWNRRLVLNSFAYLNGFNLTFQEVKSLSDKSFANWLTHRAGLYFPYDWLQTMAFYDWINMAFPTFVPDTPMYTYTMMGTNNRGWTTTIFTPPNDIYPYKYQDWEDLESRVFWWHMTDFKAMPSVQLFQSIPQLFQMLTQASMTSISAHMRFEHLQRTHSTASYWKDSLLRALSYAPSDSGENDWATCSGWKKVWCSAICLLPDLRHKKR